MLLAIDVCTEELMCDISGAPADWRPKPCGLALNRRLLIGPVISVELRTGVERETDPGARRPAAPLGGTDTTFSTD